MAYDSKDERSNDPKKVNRYLGIRELPDSAAGNSPGKVKEVGPAIENGWDTDRKRK
jgi:hypothetical protein